MNIFTISEQLVIQKFSIFNFDSIPIPWNSNGIQVIGIDFSITTANVKIVR